MKLKKGSYLPVYIENLFLDINTLIFIFNIYIYHRAEEEIIKKKYNIFCKSLILDQ
jgi:hypothetical protein